MEEERYFGSVRFFRHLILTCVGLAVLIPLSCSIFLAVRNRTLHHKNETLLAEKESLQDKVATLSEELDGLRPAAQIRRDVDSQNLHSAAGADESGWELLLVNDSHPLSQDYTVNLSVVTGGQKVDSRIVEPLSEMLQAMRKAGLRPVICSAYRSVERQSELFEEYIEEKLKAGWNYEDAFYKAKTRICIPGTSEHQTGLAVDIVGKTHQSLDDAQADTKEAKWLAEHCAEYGFILRFPEDKTDVTGVDYESWHFRYVGTAPASYIMEHELTLEEYLDSVDK